MKATIVAKAVLQRFTLPFLFVLATSVSSAFGGIQIDWASSVTNSTIVDAVDALDAPDYVLATGYNGGGGTATFGGFGAGSNVNYDSAALISLLATTETLLSQADFIAIERNGSPGLFETCTWIFRDGINTLTVPYTQGTISGPVIDLGFISNSAYSTFFGTPNPFGTDGGLAFILFDITGSSNVDPSAANFSVQLDALGIGSQPNSPEPDAMGVIVVPEGSNLIFGGVAIAGLALRNPRRRTRTQQTLA